MGEMTALPAGPFSVVLTDPPWHFTTYGKDGDKKGAANHYRTMGLDAVKALPVADSCAKDAFLLMWTTWPHLAQSLEVIKAWGFTYKTGGAWAKQTKTGNHWQFGTGYIFRSASEPLLVASRGKPIWCSKSERNLWVAPIREHSRKPPLIHEMIERATTGARLEMFARESREGWTSWGLESEKFDG